MNRQKPWSWPSIYRGLAWVGYGVLVLYVLLQKKPPFFDEVPYLAQARTFGPSDSWRAWLNNNDTGPAGPVHALLHYALSGGTGVLPAPWFRLPNLMLLGAVLALLAAGLRRMRYPRPTVAVMAVMACPMTWIMAGMALTEIPAMTGIAFAWYAAIRLGTGESLADPARYGLGLLLAGGIALGVCGRQTYLVALPALFMLGIHNRQNLWIVTCALVIGLLPALGVFAVWGGMVPPKMAFTGAGLRPLHALYALGYSGLIAVLIAPRFVASHWRWTIPAAALAVLVNLVTQTFTFTTLSSAQRFLGQPELARLLEWVASQGFVAAGAALAMAIAREWAMKRDYWFAAHVVGVALLCGVCAGVTHQFSSRYVGMALPFLIPLLARWMDFGPWAIARLFLGMSAGALALHSYYVFT